MVDSYMLRQITLGMLGALITSLSLCAKADNVWEWEGHTYELITEASTWVEANAHAESKTLAGERGYLFRVDSKRENDHILRKILLLTNEAQRKRSQPNDGADVAFLWLGGNDLEIEGEWRWSNDQTLFWLGDFNGAPVDDQFSNWGVQPDSLVGDEDGLAMSMAEWPAPFYDLGNSGQWNDLSQDNKLMYVIEYSNVSDLKLGMNEPAPNRTYSGIGMIRGWAISSEKINAIEVYLNGRYRYAIPTGESRPDIARRYPDIKNAESAGFSMPINYSGLPEGKHELTIKITDEFDSVIERSIKFETVRFEKAFVGLRKPINISQSDIQGLEDNIYVYDAVIEGIVYDFIRLQWRPGTQKFEIVEICGSRQTHLECSE